MNAFHMHVLNGIENLITTCYASHILNQSLITLNADIMRNRKSNYNVIFMCRTNNSSSDGSANVQPAVNRIVSHDYSQILGEETLRDLQQFVEERRHPEYDNSKLLLLAYVANHISQRNSNK